jgi:SAM-dependent methyltransferase
MHPPVYEYVADAVAAHGPFATVVEIGARDVNGSVRPLFGDCEYVGIDIRPGPGVDVVADAESFVTADADCVVCTEVLEHAPNAEAICRNALSWLRPGGVFIVTAAGPGRRPHSAIDEQPIRRDEHYANVSFADLSSWLAEASTVSIDCSVPGDIRAVAFR